MLLLVFHHFFPINICNSNYIELYSLILPYFHCFFSKIIDDQIGCCCVFTSNLNSLIHSTYRLFNLLFFTFITVFSLSLKILNSSSTICYFSTTHVAHFFPSTTETANRTNFKRSTRKTSNTSKKLIRIRLFALLMLIQY